MSRETKEWFSSTISILLLVNGSAYYIKNKVLHPTLQKWWNCLVNYFKLLEIKNGKKLFRPPYSKNMAKFLSISLDNEQQLISLEIFLLYLMFMHRKNPYLICKHWFTVKETTKAVFFVVSIIVLLHHQSFTTSLNYLVRYTCCNFKKKPKVLTRRSQQVLLPTCNASVLFHHNITVISIYVQMGFINVLC